MITFGRFGNLEDNSKEKEEFLENLNLFFKRLNYRSSDEHKYKENEIIRPFKEALKRESNSYFNWSFTLCYTIFLEAMGLSYYTLTKKEKEDLLDMDFTYENWKEKSSELIQNFIERLKDNSPRGVWFCFDDICFIFHIEIVYEHNFSLKNIISYIRDYYILENTLIFLKKHRNAEQYKKIQKKIIDIYPEIKEKYGMNKTLEKILSFITMETDYNYEKTKNLLDNYYNKKKNNKIEDEESMKLKDKFD